MRFGRSGAFAVALLLAVGTAAAQREGPLEVKPSKPGTGAQPAEAEGAPASLPLCPAEEGRTSTGECLWSEVVVSADGKVQHRVRPPGYDPLLAHVVEEVQRFTEMLPDFICDQLTHRFDSDSRPPRWRLRDRVSAEVLYLGGYETYQNVKRNNKPVEYVRVEQTGTWSTGEFGTLMRDLFFPTTAARFSYVKDSEIAGGTAKIYDFSVPQQGSHWRVDFQGRVIYPAYKGSVWIHPENLRVLRLEMQARDVPPSYPMDVIEMTVDFGPVRIAGQDYLLPIEAENLACKRYSNYCTRNEIVFRNHRRFTTESVVTTTDSTITYEDP